MTIVAPPIPLPITTVKWRLNEQVQVNRSAWTSRRKVIGLPGAARWTANVEMVPIRGEGQVRRWRGWIASLRGAVNTFPLRATEAQQTSSANPLCGVGGTAGIQMPLTGLPVSATVLAAGQFLTVPLPSGHHRLVCLTADLVSDGVGHGVASFAPELGEIPVSGTTVEMQRPYALMALTGDPAGWDVSPGQLYSIALDCEEAL